VTETKRRGRPPRIKADEVPAEPNDDILTPASTPDPDLEPEPMSTPAPGVEPEVVAVPAPETETAADPEGDPGSTSVAERGRITPAQWTEDDGWGGLPMQMREGWPW
jgi:hypothetical protein